MDEAAIEAAAGAVERLVGREPQAVIPVHQPHAGDAFVCAVPDGEALGWVVIDGDGVPLAERNPIRQVVELAVVCEAAEEAAAALALDEALPALAEAWRVARDLGEQEAEIAAHAAYQALEALQPLVSGLRVADPAYLDRLAQAAQLVGDRFDLLREAAGAVSARLTGQGADPLEELASALWSAIRLLSRDGPPDQFARAVEASFGPADAFADDVLDGYLVPLTEPSELEDGA